MNKAEYAAKTATAAFKKEERRRETMKAMDSYNAERAGELKKMERLRALRLAKEAEDAAELAANPPPTVAVKKRTRKKAEAES